MITLHDVDLTALTGKSKNLLFGFSLDTGDLTSVQIVEKTSQATPNMAGWLTQEYPADSEAEEFKLADAFAWLAVNAPGWGRISSADLTFNDGGKLTNMRVI